MRGGGSSGKSSPVPRSTRQSLQVSQKQDTPMPAVAVAVESDTEVIRDSGPDQMDTDANGTVLGNIPGKGKKETGGDENPSESSTITAGTKTRTGSPEPVVAQEAMDTDSNTEEKQFTWTHKLETLFFKSLMKHKPLGIHKNFQMLLAAHEFKTAAGMEDVNIEYLWKHLSEMYCIEELEDIERENAMPMEEVDFELPDKEFGELVRNFIETKDAKVKEPVKVKDTRPLSPPIAVSSAGVKRTFAKSAKSVGRKSGGGKQNQ